MPSYSQLRIDGYGRITEVPLNSELDDAVNHPGYYKSGGIEPIDYIIAKDMDFLIGNVCKYISRAGLKNPEKELEDLEKARFYLDKKIEMLKNKK